MRYFITGATGFIGGHIARQLVGGGHTVVALVRSPERAMELRELGLELVAGDITEKESMRAAMTNADGVFHIAAWYKVGVKDKSMADTINVGGTRNVLEMMKELGVRKGVYTSTLAVFSDTHGMLVDESYFFAGTHLSEYDRTKWVAHYEVALPMMKAGLPLVIVQPGLVYGPGDTSSVATTFRQYLQRKLPMVPQETAFCWAHVDDIARAHILAMEKGTAGESYIIAGPRHTLVEAMQMSEQLTGIKAPSLRGSPGMLRAMAGVMTLVEKIAPVPEAYSSESLRIVAGVTYLGDNSKAKQQLGYRPRSLEEGLRQTLDDEMRKLGITPIRQQ